MLSYINIFLNLITWHILGYFQFDTFMHKVDLMLCISITYFFIYKTFNYMLFKNDFKFSYGLLFSIALLILINFVLYSKLHELFHLTLLYISTLQLIIYIILNSYLNKCYIKYTEQKIAEKTSHKTTWYNYNQDEHQEKEQVEETIGMDDVYENTYEEMIDIKLEEYLVLFDLPHKFTLSELKHKYRKHAQKYHPDKFPPEEKSKQEKIMKNINNAKNYLQEHLSCDIA